MRNIDATAKMADVLGLATDQLTGYQLQAGLAGVNNKELETAFRRLQKNISDATKGLTTAQRAFEDLNLNAEELEKLSPDEQFKRVAEAFSTLDTQAKRARVSQDLFGRSGLKLIKIMEQGRGGIEAARKEAERLGLSFDRVDAAKVEAANDAVTRLKAAFAGLGNTLAIGLAPTIEKIADRMTGWLADSLNLVGALTSSIGKMESAIGLMGNTLATSVLKPIREVLSAIVQLQGAIESLPLGKMGRFEARFDFGDAARDALDMMNQTLDRLADERLSLTRLTASDGRGGEGGGDGGGESEDDRMRRIIGAPSLVSGRLIQGTRNRENNLEMLAKERKRIAEDHLRQQREESAKNDALRALLLETLPQLINGGQVPSF